MKCYIFAKPKGNFLRIEELTPACNEDFCDSCGDCLYCYGDESCAYAEDKNHFWVRYEEIKQ